MKLNEEQYRAIANALTEGQGGFTEEELELAISEVTMSLVKGELAALLLEGMLVMRLKDGEFKYESSARGKADLQNRLAERGVSLEQFKEEVHRGTE